MEWLYLLIAGVFEISWVVGIKHCDGFKPNIALFVVVSSMALSVIFLWFATRTIPLNIAYAAWTGIGIVGVSVYTNFALKEPISILEIIFVSMILIGIIGLKLGIK
jgi:quaternary ammonium compound-resistance protein SugE